MAEYFTVRRLFTSVQRQTASLDFNKSVSWRSQSPVGSSLCCCSYNKRTEPVNALHIYWKGRCALDKVHKSGLITIALKVQRYLKGLVGESLESILFQTGLLFMRNVSIVTVILVCLLLLFLFFFHVSSNDTTCRYCAASVFITVQHSFICPVVWKQESPQSSV